MTDAPAIRFGPQVCGDTAAGAEREWLVPDGLGGYAMGTVCGLRTRRYHALLTVAAPGSPARRHVGLVALDPVVGLPSGAAVRLGTHEWASGATAPDGHRYLESFVLEDGLPRWRWRIGDVVVERELAMVHGASSLGVVYRLLAGAAELAVEALCTWRDAHGERRASGQLSTTPAGDGVIVEGAYRLAGPGWQPGGEWHRGVYAREEAARGLNPVEDLWYAGRFTAPLTPGQALEVSAWAGDLGTRPPPPRMVIDAARQRARRVVAAAKPVDAAAATLALAADAFVVDSATVVDSGTVVAGGTVANSGPEIVAGYPWFGAWSRDTMIAYEGLLLDTGRADEGRALLRRYAASLSEGMLANTADTGQTEYNTADASLWFLHAVDRHVVRTGDTDLAAELFDPLSTVVGAHVAGTRFGIGIDPADGLLRQGADGHALTWMDARIDGVPVTPRRGKAVEINALWVNGLAAVSALGARLGRDTAHLDQLHARAKGTFAASFRSRRGWLCDVVGDDRLRPNQLLAWSLPYAPLAPDPGALAAIGRELLTPLGLRTLAPAEADYRGEHRGGPAERDTAYHQGTGWPWLLGPYADAVVTSHTVTVDLLAGTAVHLSEWGLGSVSETFDGDAPHRGTGCPFQAWSVAEILRIRQKTGRALPPVNKSSHGGNAGPAG